MRNIASKLSLAERHIPAVPKSLLGADNTSKVDNQNALLGFLASGDSQVTCTYFSHNTFPIIK